DVPGFPAVRRGHLLDRSLPPTLQRPADREPPADAEKPAQGGAAGVDPRPVSRERSLVVAGDGLDVAGRVAAEGGPAACRAARAGRVPDLRGRSRLGRIVVRFTFRAEPSQVRVGYACS